jgi:hypothetical protein
MLIKENVAVTEGLLIGDADRARISQLTISSRLPITKIVYALN